MKHSSKLSLADEFTCKIRLLDDSELSYTFNKEIKGSSLLDFVCGQIDLVEKDYFGLRYVDSIKQRHWLNLRKPISKQLKDCKPPFMFFFRIKLYPSDPCKLAEEITRYQFYLQLKRDILHGRLLCPFNNVCELAACIVQAELGNYSEEEHGEEYVKDMNLVPRQNPKFEEKIMESHKQLVDLTPADAELKFLDLAKSEDLYGVDPHPCRDSDESEMYLGLTSKGIQIIKEARKVSGFDWSVISKVSYDNTTFYLQTMLDKHKKNYSFQLRDTPACKHLWKCAVEQMSFFSDEPVKTRVPHYSTLSPHNIFRKSKYKFRGKTETELIIESNSLKRNISPDFERNMNLRVSVQKSIATRRSLQNMENISEASQNLGNDSPACAGSETASLNSSESKDESNEERLRGYETDTFPSDPASNRDSIFVVDSDDNTTDDYSLDDGSKSSAVSSNTSLDKLLECEESEETNHGNEEEQRFVNIDRSNTISGRLLDNNNTEKCAPELNGESPHRKTSSEEEDEGMFMETTPLRDDKLSPIRARMRGGVQTVVASLTVQTPVYVLLLIIIGIIPLAMLMGALLS